MTFQPKIIFLDIDETLLINHGEKHIPESAKVALRQLKQLNIITAIATGRTIAVLPEEIRALANEVGIELIIAINGQYVEYRRQALATFPIPHEVLQNVSSSLKAHGIGHALVGHTGAFVALDNVQVQAAMGSLAIPYTCNPEAYKTNEIYQMLAFYGEEQDALVASLLPENWKVIRWHKLGVDLLDKAGSKARGIQAALQQFNLTASEAMAFGDAHNDREMIELVGCGVAMGNAVSELKAVANYVCPTIENDGVYRGLVELGVIDDVLRLCKTAP